MESCLLCLEIHSDKLNCIRTESKKWVELNIANTIEKHFWPLSTIRLNSFICSPCWTLVDDFHKLYTRVEEAHMKFVIKVETENINDDYYIQKPGTDQSVEDVNTDVNIKNEPLDLDEDMESTRDITRKQIIETGKDKLPPQKMGNENVAKSRKRKFTLEKSQEIKKKSQELNDDTDSGSDIDEDSSDVDSQSDTNSSDNYPLNTDRDFRKDRASCQENEKLIIDYLKQINCNICKAQVENFSDLLKHFLKSHQQKGYILCCNRKFFAQTDLADHIQCHLNPNYFRCGQCDKMFSGRIFLEQHKLCEHSADEIAKEHFCEVCNKVFLNEQSLKLHKLSHLPRTDTKSFCKGRNKFYVSLTENNFEQPFVENIQELNANRNAALPNASGSLHADFGKPLPPSRASCVTVNDVKNEDIFAILTQIVQGQKECNTQLKKLEQNQTKMLHHKNMLSNGQVVIVNNQQQIADTLEKLVASIVPRPEMITQAKLLTECKVSIKKVEESICRMNSETCDNRIKEVASLLPLQSLAAVQEVEQKLETPDFAQAMMLYLHKVKGTSEDVSSVIRTLFTDDLLEKFNWEGRWEKQSLGKLMLFNKTLRDVFQQQKAFDFEKSVKKAIERSHHRLNQKKYLKKENK